MLNSKDVLGQSLTILRQSNPHHNLPYIGRCLQVRDLTPIEVFVSWRIKEILWMAVESGTSPRLMRPMLLVLYLVSVLKLKTECEAIRKEGSSGN